MSISPRTMEEVSTLGLYLPPGPVDEILIPSGTISDTNRPLYEVVAQYGNTVHAVINGVPIIATQDPQIITYVLVDQRKEFLHGYGSSLEAVFDGSWILLPHEPHRDARRKISPAFNPTSLSGLYSTIERVIDSHINEWLSKGNFSCIEACTGLTLEVIASLIGLPKSDYAKYRELYPIISNGAYHPLGSTELANSIIARTELIQMVARVIADRHNNPANDFTSLMINAGFTDQQVMSQDIVLGFAGHETTRKVIASAIMELSRHPELMQGIMHERASENNLSNVTFRPTKNMGLTNRIILATLLSYGPATLLPRVAQVDSTLPNGFQIPRGWQVKLFMESMHEKIFGNRDFDPKRFLDPTDEQRKHFAPFGLGPHACIGVGLAMQEAFLVLQKLCDYTWQTTINPSGKLPKDIEIKNFSRI